MKQEQRYQLDDGQQYVPSQRSKDDGNQQRVEEMFPGIPIVRGNTPRPLSFHSMHSSMGQFERSRPLGPEPFPAFPSQAPMAPPLPEEADVHEEDEDESLDEVTAISGPEASEEISLPDQFQTTSSRHELAGESALRVEGNASEQIPAHPMALDEHNTDALPALNEHMLVAQQTASLTSRIDAYTNRWLMIFSLYLASLLLVALVFAALQGLGLGHKLAGGRFTPLGVPWLVLMYGLLGGCVSCIVTLGRFRTDSPPVFIIISWFTRPFIGSILAILAYLLLTCGIFSLGGNAGSSGQNMALLLLAGAVAGFGESRIFFKYTESTSV